MLVFDEPDFELTWPRQLFIDEAKALAAAHDGGPEHAARVEWLLEEAFFSSTPAGEYRAAPRHKPRTTSNFGDPWATSFDDPSPPAEKPALTQAEFLDALIERASTLREASEPRPYWSARKRNGSAAPRQALTIDEAKRRFVRTIGEFSHTGYLDQTFGRECVDERDYAEVNGSVLLQELLGTPDLWPLQPESWNDDTFYDLIEAFHDRVARPRKRWWHDYSSCGWHYENFAIAPARALYRWRMNKILAASDIPLQLAEQGEDAGRLVHLVADDRAVLVDRALQSPEPAIREQIQHAIALFRGRNATAQDKRSAIVALAHVLERRRGLLKDNLLRSDEGALFRIANEFAIRHENEKQRSDYDLVFLDWVFWWYLATIELTDRLLQQNRS